jgi:stearoyl-CoA desaturase (Delta-9 desaturase)
MRLLIALTVGFAVTEAAIICTTVYLHRCLAHKAIWLSPLVTFPMRVVLWISTGLNSRAWAAVHRKHHAYTDTPDDPHSPAILGWKRVQLTNPALYRRCAVDPNTTERFAKDLRGDRWDAVLFNRAWLGLALGITAMIAAMGPLYGTIASAFHAVAYLQLSGAVNAVSHRFGRRPYENSATNLQSLALVTGGEGLHNNHHAAPTSARFSLQRRQLDPGWWLIRTLKAFHLATVRLDKPVFAHRAPRTPETVT